MSSSNTRTTWFCTIDGVHQGPLTTKELQTLVVTGKLLEEHIVWKNGSTKKVPAHKVQGLFPTAPSANESSTQAKGTNANPHSAASAYDVFLSYSSHDKSTADAICATLERDKVRCWIAPRDVVPGISYGESIIDAINESRVMVIIFSSASDRSQQVLREVERAVSKGIIIVPFRIEEIEPSKSMEYFLSTPHWLDALSKPLERHIDRLSEVVQTMLDSNKLKKTLKIHNENNQKKSASRYDNKRQTKKAHRQKEGYGPEKNSHTRRKKRVKTKSSSGISLRAIVGIVFGCIFGFCFIAGGVGYLFKVPIVKSVAKVPATKSITTKVPTTKQGDARAQYNLGVRYYNGEGGEKDYSQAVKWFRKAAEQGDAKAQTYLGFMYANGKGVEKDDTQAVKWYRKAAAQGNAMAQNSLGFRYDMGRGVEKDDSQAVKWYRKAAEQGDAGGQNNLGVKYYKGQGVEKDDSQAVKWYRKAAGQGDATAQNNLGVMYEYGKGVGKDVSQAVKWYRKAVAQGNAKAIKSLKRLGKN